jgi:hypothetical protein
MTPAASGRNSNHRRAQIRVRYDSPTRGGDRFETRLEGHVKKSGPSSQPELKTAR